MSLAEHRANKLQQMRGAGALVYYLKRAFHAIRLHNSFEDTGIRRAAIACIHDSLSKVLTKYRKTGNLRYLDTPLITEYRHGIHEWMQRPEINGDPMLADEIRDFDDLTVLDWGEVRRRRRGQ